MTLNNKHDVQALIKLVLKLIFNWFVNINIHINYSLNETRIVQTNMLSY